MAHLRPVILDELGLVSALQNMIEDWNSHHEDTFCEFQVDGLIPELADDIAINCYRIVQEALTNIARHASAERASVLIRYTDDLAHGAGILRINIDDDGIGFKLSDTPRGLGLVGIHERIDVMQGNLA